MKLTDFITDIGRPVAYYPGLKKITGSTTATILLCQLLYWSTKTDREIYKTSDQLQEETGLTYEEQKTARKKLVERGLIQESYARLDHAVAFIVDKEQIDTLWEASRQSLDGGSIKAIPRSPSWETLDGEQGNPSFVK